MSFIRVSTSEVRFKGGGIYGIEKVLDKWVFDILNEMRKNIYNLIESFSYEMVTIAKANVENANKVASEELLKGFEASEIYSYAGGFIINLLNTARAQDVGYGSYELPYWRVVEGGRGVGEKMPPPKAILLYLEEVGFDLSKCPNGITDREKKSQAYAMARAIGENGTLNNRLIFEDIRTQILARFMKHINANS